MKVIVSTSAKSAPAKEVPAKRLRPGAPVSFARKGQSDFGTIVAVTETQAGLFYLVEWTGSSGEDAAITVRGIGGMWNVPKDVVPFNAKPAEDKMSLMAAQSFSQSLSDGDLTGEAKSAAQAYLIACVKAWSLPFITKLMSTTSISIVQPWFFPSQWGITGTPYPGKLAEALVASKAEESLTDITNQYYSRDRELTPAARKVFLDFLIANPKKLLGQLLYSFELAKGITGKETPEQLSKVLDDADSIANGFGKFAKADPKAAKRLLMMLPPSHLAYIKGAALKNKKLKTLADLIGD